MRAARLPPRIAMSTCSPASQPSRRPIYLILFAAVGRRGRQRYLADRVSLAGVAAQRQRIRCLDRRGSSLVAVAVLHADRRHSGGLPWQTACFADLRCTVGDHGGGGSGAGDRVRRTSSITVGVLAVLAALGALFDPAGITARESMLPEAATNAGLDPRTAPTAFYEAIFNVAYIVGPGLGGLLIATIGGINTMWVTAGAFGVSILAIGALRLPAPELHRARHAPTGRGPGWSMGFGSCGISRCCARWHWSTWQ